MAMPVENSVTSTIARLLNLNAIDTNAYEEAFEEYFGERDDSENELSSDADESSEGEYKSNLIQSSSSRISRSSLDLDLDLESIQDPAKPKMNQHTIEKFIKCISKHQTLTALYQTSRWDQI